ncbi:GDP-L-fucose synthase [Zavarzinia sp. CC-PAN008]|uniref:GDP-L-fucose synthase n=1 Tax=Zavarzinia sp. CC-PAN008 TaxID=3243332 RepID=UPI003F747DCF
MFQIAGRRVWVAGHRGMVGSAIVRRLEREGCEVLTVSRGEVDLRDAQAVAAWIAANRPNLVFLAAATVGGILANDTRPAEFLYDNLAIETAIIHGAHRAGVEKLVFLGSSCIYPKFAEQPIRESALMTGALEPTNQWYAIAKIAGVMLCQAYRAQYGADFISVMPTNLYGPHDNFDLAASHVIPALMRKAHEAKVAGAPAMGVWGTGAPRREFLHVDDLADACVHLARVYSGPDPINAGTGVDLPIKDLAQLICKVVGFQGRLEFDTSKPDGTPRKLLDVSALQSLGWTARIDLEDGLRTTYDWFVQNGAGRRAA